MTAFSYVNPGYVALLAPAAPTAYDPDALAHRARVLADGGQGVDIVYLHALVTALKAAGAWGSFKGWWEPRLGYKLDAGHLVRLYSPDAAQRDMLPVSSYAGPTLDSSGSYPALFFSTQVLGVPSFPLGPSAYVLGALLRGGASDAGTPRLLGYGPDGGGFVGFSNANGFIRATHATGYTGAEVAVPNPGGASAYGGELLRISAEWLADRTTPSELVVTGNGQTGTIYSYNSPRGPLNSYQQNKLFTLGGMTVFNSLQLAPDLTLYCAYVLADAGGAGAMDAFVKTQFGMPA